MVNIGGRSRGCSTCRRRRVKCDERRPICKRCERCGFECTGAKDIAFIDQGKILRSRRAGKRMTILTKRDAEDRDWVDRKISVPTSASLKGFEIQIYVCYTKKYLLRGGPVDLALQELQLSDIRTAGESTEDAQMLHRAILSLAIIFFGSQHRQSSITDRGYVVHGVTLKQLNHALSDPKCYIRDDVLLSVVTLALLECFVPTGRKYYLKHMIGLEKLLELRGPTTHCSPKSFQAYDGISRMIILASLSARKPSILARAEWKSISWIDCPDEKIEEKYLYNVLADCTVAAAECDKVIANWELDIEDIAHQRDEVTRTALNLLEQLYVWRRQWDIQDRNFHFETPATFAGLQPRQETCGRSATPFPTAFIFTNISAAIILMLYNTTLINVFQILASLPQGHPGILSNEYPIKPSLEDSKPSKHLPHGIKSEYAAAARSAATEICRCIPYNLSQESSLDSASLTVAHLAVRTAKKTLDGSDSSEGRWITDLLKKKGSEVFAKGLWVD